MRLRVLYSLWRLIFYFRKGLHHIYASNSNTLYLNGRPECVWLFWTIMLCSLRRTINLFTALGESESYFILCSIEFCETCTHTELSFWMQVSRQLIWSVRVHRMYFKRGMHPWNNQLCNGRFFLDHFLENSWYV